MTSVSVLTYHGDGNIFSLYRFPRRTEQPTRFPTTSFPQEKAALTQFDSTSPVSFDQSLNEPEKHGYVNERRTRDTPKTLFEMSRKE